MVHLPVPILLPVVYRIPVSIQTNIRLTALDQRLALLRKISRSVERQACFGRQVPRRKVRQSGHERVKMPPHYYSTLARSMFAEWGLNQGEYSSRGVPSKPWPSFARSRATMSHARV